MQQLSGTDNVMLFAERRNIYNHVGALMVYDVTTAPEGKVRFKDIVRHFDSRMHLHPLFRQRLAPVPFGLDRPYWVAEPNLDLEYHIRHIALPKPGDWRQLMIQVARLHSRPLDRAHPLWEAYVIEGLDNIPKLPPGAFAIFLKIHHAVVDGMAAVHLMRELHASTPAADGWPSHPPTIIADREPTGIELLARSLESAAARAGKLAQLSARIGTRLLAAGRSQWPELARGDFKAVSAKVAGLIPAAAPTTRFSGPVSQHRVMEAFGMPLSRISRVRAKVPGTTINDVFVAVAGGAARKYLERKGELPGTSLSGLMPISLRSDGSAGGNEVAGVPVRVRSDVADPIERLLAVRQESIDSKARAEKLGLDLLKSLFEVLPSTAASGLFLQIARSVNLTVSNVRGPDRPIYMAGAKAMCLYPVSIPADGAGLNFTAVSYNGVLWVSMVSCREMLPDPGTFLDCMHESWQELLAAADALPSPSGARTHEPKLEQNAKPVAARARRAAKRPRRRASPAVVRPAGGSRAPRRPSP
ncbi:MAG TPA: wax ester/triacylglycerol synthase family O-acyltransferase [Steroidobacteraceae bacterium]